MVDRSVPWGVVRVKLRVDDPTGPDVLCLIVQSRADVDDVLAVAVAEFEHRS